MEFILIFVQHLVRMQIQHFTFDLFLDYLKQESIDKACYYKDFFLDIIDIDSRKCSLLSSCTYPNGRRWSYIVSGWGIHLIL